MLEHIPITPTCYLGDITSSIGFCELKWFWDDYKYRDHFKGLDTPVILDNSPMIGGGWPSDGYELENVITKYLHTSTLLRRPVIVAPDTLHNCNMTVKQTEVFLKELEVLPFYSRPRWMAVPQGENYEEFKYCYKWLATFKPDVIGLAYLVPWNADSSAYPEEDDSKTKFITFNRVRLVRKLRSDGIWRSDIPHHLLGLKDAIELKYQASVPNIVSNDSAFLYKTAKQGLELSSKGLVGEKTHLEIDSKESPLPIDRDNLLRTSIDLVKRWIEEGHHSNGNLFTGVANEKRQEEVKQG